MTATPRTHREADHSLSRLYSAVASDESRFRLNFALVRHCRLALGISRRREASKDHSGTRLG